MTKKEILKLVIQTYGLNPEGVGKYDFKASKSSKTRKAWKGKGTDKNNDVAIYFTEKIGFKAALVEIITQAQMVELYTEEEA